MNDARLTVQFAGPLVTIQDGGRIGHMRHGVPASGPMDRVAFAAANAAIGNDMAGSAIEVSLGGLVLECTAGSVSMAIAGGNFSIEHAGNPIDGWTVLTLNPGEKLSVRGGHSGSWAYLAFAGDLLANKWLGNAATHSVSGFGGGALRSGQDIEVDQATVREERLGDIERPDFLPADEQIRVVMGPQEQWFHEDAIDAFQNSEYELTDAFDRMGVRLAGANLPLNGALSIPSEPIIRGSVQVSGEGVPTVLLADHQTTGGYPKIATVISPDIDRLSQMRSNQSVSFDAVSPALAIEIVRQHVHDLEAYLVGLSVSRGTLSQRLMRENLISGAVFLS